MNHSKALFLDFEKLTHVLRFLKQIDIISPFKVLFTIQEQERAPLVPPILNFKFILCSLTLIQIKQLKKSYVMHFCFKNDYFGAEIFYMDSPFFASPSILGCLYAQVSTKLHIVRVGKLSF